MFIKHYFTIQIKIFTFRSNRFIHVPLFTGVIVQLVLRVVVVKLFACRVIPIHARMTEPVFLPANTAMSVIVSRVSGVNSFNVCDKFTEKLKFFPQSDSSAVCILDFRTCNYRYV